MARVVTVLDLHARLRGNDDGHETKSASSAISLFISAISQLRLLLPASCLLAQPHPRKTPLAHLQQEIRGRLELQTTVADHFAIDAHAVFADLAQAIR